MVKKTFLLVGIALTWAVRALATPASCDADLHSGVNRVTVVSGGLDRTFDLSFPDSVKAHRVPLVIALHGSSTDGATLDRETHISAAGTSKGFAVALPQGGIRLRRPDGGDGYYWNIPGVPLVNGSSTPADAPNDVQFIADLIDHVVKHGCIDRRKIYVTGMSGGARMSSLLACQLANRVAAVAPVAGLRAGRATAPRFTEPDTGDCRPSKPISVLTLHGTDDAVNPFTGGLGVRWGYDVQSAVARWASIDRCPAPPTVERLSDHVSRSRYVGCARGVEVVSYTIDAPRDQGGGHTWPGGHLDVPTARMVLGVSSREIDATEVVLEFFLRH